VIRLREEKEIHAQERNPVRGEWSLGEKIEGRKGTKPAKFPEHMEWFNTTETTFESDQY
jgi:hypothetical protein